MSGLRNNDFGLFSGGGSGGTPSGVSSVGATPPLTSSGGANPIISTSIATNKLLGRSTSGTGVAEVIAIGDGLILSAGTLTNTATPTPLGYYGEFEDNTTQTALLVNTAYPVKFNKTPTLSNGVSVVNDGDGNPTRVTFANTGVYNIQFSLQLEKISGTGNYIIDIWLRKNGVDVVDSTGKVVLTGGVAASPIVAAWNYLVDLDATDYVQLMWATSNINAVILASAATPPHPSIPSSILTVTQQSGIMSGTGFSRSINTVTTNTTAGNTLGTDYVYLVNQTTLVTITLPAASGNTNSYTIKKIGTGQVNIATTGGTIDGSTSPISINVQYVSLTLVTDGTNWFII